MRSCINKFMKTYAEYDANIPEIKEFAKLWIKEKKTGGNYPKEFVRVSGRSSFVGSGEWTYEYKGNKFSVNSFANGKGFWGTDYLIDLVKENVI